MICTIQTSSPLEEVLKNLPYNVNSITLKDTYTLENTTIYVYEVDYDSKRAENKTSTNS